jgi:hypothetical protein
MPEIVPKALNSDHVPEFFEKDPTEKSCILYARFFGRTLRRGCWLVGREGLTLSARGDNFAFQMDFLEFCKMKRSLLLSTGIFLLAIEPAAAEVDSYVTPGVPHPGSDQIFWVPTFAQAEEVARQTGRLMLVMGSVSDWNGY